MLLPNRLTLSLNGRSIICCLTLICITGVEFFAYMSLRMSWSVIWVIVATALTVGLFGVLLASNSLARFRTDTFRKLFQSLVSSWLSFVILLFFLVHLEWISNAGYDAFFTDAGFQWESLVMMILYVIALIISVFLYPIKVEAKAPEERDLIISGLSLSRVDGGYVVAPRNIDLLVKPFLDKEWSMDGKQISPKASRLVIIPSVDKIEFKILEESDKLFLDKILEYNSIVDSANSPDRIISELIKLLAGKDIKVSIANCIDYDDMKSALAAIAKELRKIEFKSGIQDTGNTLLYISPGTGVIGSALTAFAIPGERCVLYFTQTQADNHLVNIGMETGGHNSIVEEINSKE